MKKMRYIIFCMCALLLSTTSCDDFLDITPDGQVKRDELLSTAEGIEDAMYGVYSQLRLQQLYGQEMSFSTLEILAQTLWCYGSTGITAMSKYDYTHSSVQSVFQEVWTRMYNNISNVNSVLNAPLVANATEYPFSIYRGEALALRAFMHFDLVRLFAEQYTVNASADGIPYATEFSLNTPEFESLEKNYEHILGDLKTAELLLADEAEYEGRGNYMLDRQIHMNIDAVRALLARVYLTMGDNEQAYDYATKVIASEKYMLKEKTEVVGDLAGVLSRKETLFGVYSPSSAFYSYVNAKLQQTTSYFSLDLRSDIMDLYNKDASGDDYRRAAYFSESGVGDQVKYRLSKLTDTYELNNNASGRPTYLITGINLIRIPEMYYIAAEVLLDDASLSVDATKNAEWYYNQVREHRGLEAIEDGTLTLDLINEERMKEYIGEGQMFFNSKRLNAPIEGYDGTMYEASNAMYVVPIPDAEFEYRN